MNKTTKILLTLVGVGLLVKILAQKGGFLGASIENKSENLQGVFKAFKDGNWNVNSSNVLDSKSFVEFKFNTPYGVQVSKFFDDGAFELKKEYNNEVFKGIWKNNGELIVDGIGSINEGSITQSSLALNTMLL
jgi:hypothetical protein